MSRGSQQSQDDPSSERFQNILNELRRLLWETKSWPKTGNQLITDLSHINTSPITIATDEDYDMLSIVVNDAFMGIDIMKKYPAFYARMLVDEELRTAFLDTLELLEEGQDEERQDYPETKIISLDFIRKVMSKPVVKKSAKEKLTLLWRRTAEQVQTMFFINTLKPRELLRSGDYLSDRGTFNILHSRVEIDNQEVDIRLDASHNLAAPGNLNLMIAMLLPDAFDKFFKATIAWGDYQETAAINKYGMAKFPPLKIDRIYNPDGELMHGLELRLEQMN